MFVLLIGKGLYDFPKFWLKRHCTGRDVKK